MSILTEVLLFLAVAGLIYRVWLLQGRVADLSWQVGTVMDRAGITEADVQAFHDAHCPHHRDGEHR